MVMSLIPKQKSIIQRKNKMAKQLNDILNSNGLWKGVKKSTVNKLTTGKDPGVDYADKMPDTRDFVGSLSVQKHEDRVGNGPEVYNGEKQTLSTKKEKRHGYNLNSDQKVYEAKEDSKEYDYEGEMAISQLKTLMRNAGQLMSILKPETNLPEWVQSKITIAEDYITTSANYMMSELSESELTEKNWIAGAIEHPGAMTAAAKREGLSNAEYEKKHEHDSGKAGKRARLALTLKNLNKEAAMCEACGSSSCTCDDMPKETKGKGKKLLLDLAKKPLKERHMTPADKKHEESLKDKYDDSGMKQSMIKQYGPEKGKQVYFAKIRKMAMETEQTDTPIRFPSNAVGDVGNV